MKRDPVPELDILAVFEFLGGEPPHHIKTHGWTPVRCLIHGGNSASIHITANKYNCFGGCDFDGETHGDAYDLLNLVEGLSLAEAKALGEERGWIVGADLGRGHAGLVPKPHRTQRPDRAQRGRRPQRR